MFIYIVFFVKYLYTVIFIQININLTVKNYYINIIIIFNKMNIQAINDIVFGQLTYINMIHITLYSCIVRILLVLTQ